MQLIYNKRIRRMIEILFIVMCLMFPIVFAPVDAKSEDLYQVVDEYDNDIMEKKDSSYLFSKYNLLQSQYEEVYAYGPISYMDVDEIVVIKQSDKELRKSILSSTKTHIQNQIKTFEGYGIEQTKDLKNAFVEEKGSFVICVVGSNVNEIKSKILSCF